MPLRIALVQYLNSVPLGWGFTQGPLREQVEVQLCTPAECADRLGTGAAEAGLIPAAEYQRIEALRIVPGIAIATQGRARSVLLLGRVPAQSMRSVALDSSSRTSAVLVRLLLSEWFGNRPEFHTSTLDIPAMLEQHEGALVIGDRALCARLSDFPYAYDLGELWVRMTGLPFVFAIWACRGSVTDERHSSMFAASREFGCKRIGEISRLYSERLSLPAAAIEEYLLANLDYDLGPRHQQGLELFFQLACRRGLIPKCRPLDFIPS